MSIPWVLGDWDCDGVKTPALLQRPSGAVWVIDQWPEGDEAPARYVTTVAGAAGASVQHEPACDALVIGTEDGESVRPVLSA